MVFLFILSAIVNLAWLTIYHPLALCGVGFVGFLWSVVTATEDNL